MLSERRRWFAVASLTVAALALSADYAVDHPTSDALLAVLGISTLLGVVVAVRGTPSTES